MLTATLARNDYAGTGATTVFPYGFRIFAAADLRVIVRSSAGVESVKSYPTDFNVSGVGNTSGGSVTFTVPPLVTDTLVILRATPLTQATDLANQGRYAPADVEAALDRIVAISQQQQNQLDASLKIRRSLNPSGRAVELEPTAGYAVVGDGLGGFTMGAISAGAVVLPGTGRTTTTLSAYLLNNAVFNVLDYAPVGLTISDGVGDATSALQTAATNCPDGATILVPPGSYKLTSPILNVVGKNITWVIQGTLLDRISAGWATNYADLTLNSKGLFCFSGGRVAVIANGQLTVSGPSGVGGVSQGTRTIFYFYNCTSVVLQDLNTILATGSSVASYACSNIVQRGGSHSGGYAMVAHTSPNGCTVDSVTATGGLNSGVTTGNRGSFPANVLPWVRGKNIQLLNCKVSNLTNPGGFNDAAVGMSCDSVDDYVCTNNVVDGAAPIVVGTGTVTAAAGAATFTVSQTGVVAVNAWILVNNIQYLVTAVGGGGTTATLASAPTFGASAFSVVNHIGTFAYSFADTTRGLVVGNSGKNYNNVHIGSTLPGGIGMECIRVASSAFVGNFFQNVMCAYQIADCTDSIYDGVYENIPAATVALSDSAFSCFAQCSNSGVGSDNLRISGVQVGGNYGVVLATGNHKIYIENLYSRRVFRSFVSGTGGAVVADYLAIRNSSGEMNAASTADGINLVAGTVTDGDIDNVRLYSPGIGNGFSAISAGGTGRIRIGGNCRIVSFESGIDGANAALAELRIGQVDFTNVVLRTKNTGSVVSLAVDTPSLSAAGVPVLANVITYSASMTPDCLNGRDWVITATNGTAFTLNAPTNKMIEEITITIRNASGGARGVCTFNAIYKQVGEAVGNSTNGNSTSARFKYDGTNYVQITAWTVNVPN